MPLARIILAGVNVLLAIVFMWLASASWGKRHAWAYAVFRHDLAIRGLPVDEEERDENDDKLAGHLSDRTLQELFRNTSPVRTQKQEAEARHKQLRSELDGLGDEAARRQRALELLRSLARTGSERDDFAQMKTEDLLTAFDAAFSPARTGKDPGGKDMSYDQWRRAIAHALFNTSDKADDQARLLTVLGVRSYAQAADQKAATLREMAQRVQLGIDSDRTAYAIQHKQLLQRIFLLAERVADLKTTLQQNQELREKHQKLLTARQADVKEFEERLAKANAEKTKALQEQATLESELFTVQRMLGQTLEKNEELEQAIRSREKSK